MIKLNLGCGLHHPEGFINIDINPKVNPDIIADVSKLSYEDNTVDKILASHIIEHFFVWKIPEILKEWYRVLKVSGVIQIECPDLHKVLKNYYERPDDMLLSMGGLYGDYTEKNETQVHYWCYTYPELKLMLLDAGFREVAPTAQLGHDVGRDMALIGVK
jgi:ubiquinone/menaquinone biosynthesis C-methylase UbiE